MEFLSLIADNKEWIFSGIGVTALLLFFKFFQKSKPNQSQKSGKNSFSIQSGRDTNFYSSDKD